MLNATLDAMLDVMLDAISRCHVFFLDCRPKVAAPEELEVCVSKAHDLRLWLVHVGNRGRPERASSHPGSGGGPATARVGARG